MKAYYFSNTDKKLRYEDGREIVAGKMHTVKGMPMLCKHGLHGSIKALDALDYAPGAYIWRVDITRHVQHGEAKIVGQRRKYLWGFDAAEVLREFARKQAMLNIEKVKPYCSKEQHKSIINWLETGKEEYRKDAWYAADSVDADSAAAQAAAYNAAQATARASYRAAVRAYRVAYRVTYQAAAWVAANDMLEGMIEKEAKKLNAR